MREKYSTLSTVKQERFVWLESNNIFAGGSFSDGGAGPAGPQSFPLQVSG